MVKLPAEQITIPLSWVVAIGAGFRSAYRVWSSEHDARLALAERLKQNINISICGNGALDARNRGKWMAVAVTSETDAPLLNCETWMTRLELLDRNSNVKDTIIHEPGRCEWSMRKEMIIDIPPGIGYRANLFFVSDEMMPCALSELVKEYLQFWRYRVSILVCAKDTENKSASLIFDCHNFDDASLTWGSEISVGVGSASGAPERSRRRLLGLLR